jgi:Ca-activated chloride channel family protein
MSTTKARRMRQGVLATLVSMGLVLSACDKREPASSQVQQAPAESERETTAQELLPQAAATAAPSAADPAAKAEEAKASPPKKAKRSLDLEGDAPADVAPGFGVVGPGARAGGAPPPPAKGANDGHALGVAARPMSPMAIPERTPEAPVVPDEKPIDPNGRFATTYRPGGGHLAAFESAVARGLVPAAEREIVSDVGARYAATVAKPKDTAIAMALDLERGKAAPSGGPTHLRLSLQGTEQKATERPRLSLHVVFDVSGSMRGELIDNARKAAVAMVGKLADDDELSLTTFSTDAQVIIENGPVGARRASIVKSIEGIQVQGGTNIGAGLMKGYGEAAKSKIDDAVKVVFLLSDGRANEGITASPQLSRLALDAFQAGVQTSSFGLGTDYDGPLMSAIAQDGAGGYYYLRDAEQIAPALTTEVEKRLDPVATAVEVRIRFKPDVEVLKVYGSQRLGEDQAARVRAIEVAADKQAEKKDKIAANRQEDREGGMRFFIPAYARDDSHAILLKLKVPAGAGNREVAIVELKYKDRVAKKNVTDEFPLKIAYADSDAASAATIDMSMARTVQGFGAGEALATASRLYAKGDRAGAANVLAEREGLLHYASLSLHEPLFVRDAQRLARLRELASGGAMKDPLVMAMLTETASNVHLR